MWLIVFVFLIKEPTGGFVCYLCNFNENIYTSSVFCYDKHLRKILTPLFQQATSVTYEPVAPAAVLNTALLCI